MLEEEINEKIIDTIKKVKINDVDKDKESGNINNNVLNVPAAGTIFLNDSGELDNKFYLDAKKYWSEIPPTIDGMLGGFGFISSVDIKGSINFLNDLFKENLLQGKINALDCGAGIGRVSKHLLMKYFDKVDLVEQDAIFAQTASEYCKGDHLGSIYNKGLQEFKPEEHKYNLIWSQWVLGHLTDEDLLCFFERIQKGLCKKNGIFVIKENVTSSRKSEKDEIDSSVTRPLKKYEKLIKKADLQIVKSNQQFGLPKGLYQVYFLACRPINN